MWCCTVAGSGRWALKNVQRGYFLGSSQDELKCTAKAPGESEYWLVHLAARPQVGYYYYVYIWSARFKLSLYVCLYRMNDFSGAMFASKFRYIVFREIYRGESLMAV